MGNEYAYVQNKPNKADFVVGAKRVRALRLFKQPDPHGERERLTSMVDVQFLNVEDGKPVTTGYYSQVRAVRARDFLARWEDYQVELNRRKREEDAREQLYQERIKLEKQALEALYKHLEEHHHIPRDWIQGMSSRVFYIDRKKVEADIASMKSAGVEVNS